MKVLTSVLVFAFLMVAASQALAFTNQDQYVCKLAQVACPAENTTME